MKKIVVVIILISLLSILFSVKSFSPKKQNTNTTLYVVNQSTDTVEVWLTLSQYSGSLKNYFVQDVKGIFGIKTIGSSGMFILAPNDTVSYQSLLALSGNICFGGQAINCPTTDYPTGTNIFEFCLNNNFGVAPQESVEISCVSGVNSFISGELSNYNWIVTTGIDSIQNFNNGALGNNSNRYGVFPTGCTNCTNQQGAPICNPSLPFDAPNTIPICIIQRPANLLGGSVFCKFTGFTDN